MTLQRNLRNKIQIIYLGNNEVSDRILIVFTDE